VSNCRSTRRKLPCYTVPYARYLTYRKSVTSQGTSRSLEPIRLAGDLDLKPISPSSPVPRLETGETPHKLPPSALHS